MTTECLLRDFGRRVAEIRAERNLTQEQLADSIGVAARYVQQIEAGRQNVTLGTVAKLANGLRTPVAEFFQKPANQRG